MVPAVGLADVLHRLWRVAVLGRTRVSDSADRLCADGQLYFRYRLLTLRPSLSDRPERLAI
jgi:hypothetical protein